MVKCDMRVLQHIRGMLSMYCGLGYAGCM